MLQDQAAPRATGRKRGPPWIVAATALAVAAALWLATRSMAVPQRVPMVEADAPTPTAGKTLVPVASTDPIERAAPGRTAVSAALMTE